MRFIKSISSQCAPVASVGLTMVCNCQSRQDLVSSLIGAVFMRSIKLARSAGSIAGKCLFGGFGKAAEIPLKGLLSMIPVLVANVIISLIR